MIYHVYFFELAGGVALVLYGIHLMGTNLQKILGYRTEAILKRASGSPLKGLLAGAGITAAIRSSGTTAVMLVGLATGSFMSLSQSIAVMLGANIGSTIAIQLTVLRPGLDGIFAVIVAGVLIHLLSEKKLGKQAGEATIGLGLIFLGAEIAFSNMPGLVSYPGFLTALRHGASDPVVVVIAGAFLTVLVRSATMMSMLAVALAGSGALALRPALWLVLGINLGSSLKVAFSAFRGKGLTRALGTIHLLNGLTSLALFAFLFDGFSAMVMGSSSDTAQRIANANTLFNLLGALFFLPFVPLAAEAVQKTPPKNKSAGGDLDYLDRDLICTPSIALRACLRAADDMLDISSDMLEDARLMLLENKTGLDAGIMEKEKVIDHMTEKISEYIIQVSQQDLDKACRMRLYSLLHAVADIEHLSDRIVDIAGIIARMDRDDPIIFSEKAGRDLAAAFGKLRIIQNLVIKALNEDNAVLAREITEHENKVDEIIKRIQNNHEKRVGEGGCDAEAGSCFSRILSNLERIGDHYDNIAYTIIDQTRSDED